MNKIKQLIISIWITLFVMIICGNFVIFMSDDLVRNNIIINMIGVLVTILMVYGIKGYIEKKKIVIIYISSILFMLLLSTPLCVTVTGVRRWLGWNNNLYLRPSGIVVLTTIIVLGTVAKVNKDITSISYSYCSEMIIPMVSYFIISYYSGFIDNRMSVIVIAIVANCISYKSIKKKISVNLFWGILGIKAIIDSRWIRYILEDNRKDSIAILLKNKEFFKYKPLVVVANKFGIIGVAGVLVLFFVLLVQIWFAYKIVKKNNDLNGAIVVLLIGSHLMCKVFLALMSNFSMKFSVPVPFFQVEQWDVLIYIVEIGILQMVLKKNLYDDRMDFERMIVK